MLELVAVFEYTAFLRRTEAPLVDPLSDSWWLRSFNDVRHGESSGCNRSLLKRDGLRSKKYSQRRSRLSWGRRRCNRHVLDARRSAGIIIQEALWMARYGKRNFRQTLSLWRKDLAAWLRFWASYRQVPRHRLPRSGEALAAPLSVRRR